MVISFFFFFENKNPNNRSFGFWINFDRFFSFSLIILSINCFWLLLWLSIQSTGVWVCVCVFVCLSLSLDCLIFFLSSFWKFPIGEKKIFQIVRIWSNLILIQISISIGKFVPIVICSKQSSISSPIVWIVCEKIL